MVQTRKLKKNFKCLLIWSLLFVLFTSQLMAEQAILVAGASNQQGGSIELKESKAGMFQKGELEFTIDSGEYGIYLEDVEVETTGGIKSVKSKVTEGKHGKVTVSIKRETREAGTIKLSKFVFTVDRTVPEGSYDLAISGSAISDSREDKIVIEDFIKIGTPNTEDCEIKGLSKGNVQFIVGEKYYLQGKTQVTMEAETYIDKSGYIMVPMAYIAEAFSISKKDILFSEGTVTIITPQRTISIKNGEDTAWVNGNKVVMTTCMVINEGRAYIPAGQIANLLGIKVEWDNDNKTAYFINE